MVGVQFGILYISCVCDGSVSSKVQVFASVLRSGDSALCRLEILHDETSLRRAPFGA